ncbi:hypothetical protein KIH39_00695 [Telmatocola sphagniphila]|jgi:hypothetical protein|uniref:Lipoprotein n=1 Tax=Telmatocola sphagniphila TaxID=1123043 RepID=A0A8E6EVD6_9BACT|nr:hypothetical protein [Telmatocola sphagniphila]QVL32467.1 hypothetical protein KIH39_00695 [Telmatocola sphagniphila]
MKKHFIALALGIGLLTGCDNTTNPTSRRDLSPNDNKVRVNDPNHDVDVNVNKGRVKVNAPGVDVDVDVNKNKNKNN